MNMLIANDVLQTSCCNQNCAKNVLQSSNCKQIRAKKTVPTTLCNRNFQRNLCIHICANKICFGACAPERAPELAHAHCCHSLVTCKLRTIQYHKLWNALSSLPVLRHSARSASCPIFVFIEPG